MSLSYFQPLYQFAAGLLLLLFCLLPAYLFDGVKRKAGVQPLRMVIILVCSLILLISCYSFYRTGFNTINIGFLLVFILFFFTKRYFGKADIERSTIGKWNFATYLFGLYAFWFVFLLLTLHLEIVPGLIKSPERDMLYYSELSSQLSRGLEDSRLLSSNVVQSRVPYHYLELWLNSLLSVVLKISPFQTLVLATRAVLLALISLCFWAMARTLWGEKKSAVITYFVPLLLLLKPIAFYSFSNLTYFTLSHLFAPKAEVFFLFILLELFLFLRYRKFTLFGFSLLLIASITAVPGLTAFVVILLVVQWFSKKKFVFLTGAASFFATLLFIVSYYAFNGRNKVPGGFSLSSNEALQIYSLRTAFNVILGNYIYILYVLLPFLTVFVLTLIINKVSPKGYFKNVISDRNWLLPLFISLVVISSILSGFLYVLIDSYQIFMLISISLVTILCAFFVLDMMVKYKVKPITFVFIAALLIFSIGRHVYGSVDYNPRETVSKEFLEQIEAAYEDGSLKKGGFMPKSNFYKSLYEWNDKLSWMGQFLYYIDPSLRTVNMDMDASLLSKDKTAAMWQQKVLEISDYPVFCMETALMDKEACQQAFIREKGIDFVISAEPVPAHLRDMFSDSLVDEHSGVIMYLKRKL